MRDGYQNQRPSSCNQDKLVENPRAHLRSRCRARCTDLGLIYEINLDESGHCKITMTLRTQLRTVLESLLIAIMDPSEEDLTRLVRLC